MIFEDKLRNNSAYFFTKTYVVGAQYKCLVEADLMSTHNKGFYEDLTKIIFQLSNTPLISFSGKD